jgi:hypothetical protein
MFLRANSKKFWVESSLKVQRYSAVLQVGSILMCKPKLLVLEALEVSRLIRKLFLCRGAFSGLQKKGFRIIPEFYLQSFNEAVFEECKKYSI